MATVKAFTKTSLAALGAAFLLASAAEYQARGGSAGSGGSGGSRGGGGFSAPSRSSSSGGFSSGNSGPARSSPSQPVQRPSSPPAPSTPPSAPPPGRAAPIQRYAPPSPPEQAQPRPPVVRYAPPASPSPVASDRGGDVARETASDGPSQRVFDSEREHTRGARPERGSAERDDSGVNGPDLSRWGRPVRTSVPVVRDSPDTFRPAPGASHASPLERISSPGSRLDRESILERYRGRDRSSGTAKAPVLGLPTVNPERSRPRSGDAPPWIVTEKRTPPVAREGTGLSQLRSRRSAPPAWIERNDRGRDDVRTAPRRGEPKSDLQKIRSRAKESSQVESARRLDRLVGKDPKTATDILKKGGQLTVATDAAVRTAVGVSLSLSGGGSAGRSCFWDPCSSWTQHCAPFWNWWCSPCGSWWWSSCCFPWWGCGYWCGGWSHSWSCWSGSCWPSYCYAPYPLYYSTVVYDSYSPPPAQEVVYVEQPAAPAAEQAPAAEAPAAEGEGSIQVAAPGEAGASGARGGTQALATQHLTLGDEAFKQGRYSDAVHEYAKAVELQPDQGVLHLILSDALFATGDYHYAAYALRRALELDPTLVDSVIDKHSFYGEPAEFDRQLDLLERYLEDHFLDEDARLLLAANYLFGAKPAQAADLLKSPFSSAVRETPAGKVLVERANKLLHEPASNPDSPK